MLPLSIAGEKPERAWLEELLEADGPRRPAHAPAVRALRRPAAARRARARARHAADDPLRRRADRQPRLEDRAARSSSCCATRSTRYGQTTVMVTHEARAAAIADRILFLADGLIVRSSTGATRRRRARRHGRPRLVIGVALKGLAGRKLRAALTAISIVLGVAMISGTYVLTDTIKAALQHGLHAGLQEHRRRDHRQERDRRQREPGHHAAVASRSRCSGRCARSPASRVAEGGISDEAKLVGRNDKVDLDTAARRASRSASTRTATSGSIRSSLDDRPLAGRRRTRSRSTRRRPNTKHYALGAVDRRADGHGPVQQFKIVGIVRFGGLSSLGGATLAIFDLPTAQRIFHKVGKLDSIGIAVEAERDARPARRAGRSRCSRRPRRCAPARRRRSRRRRTRTASSASSSTSCSRSAFIALFVGTFVIANTLGITIAQRMRELATLRTLGATRRQVYWSVVLEAFVIGVIASVIGLFLGLGLAKLLNALFVSFGIDLPQVGDRVQDAHDRRRARSSVSS